MKRKPRRPRMIEIDAIRQDLNGIGVTREQLSVAIEKTGARVCRPNVSLTWTELRSGLKGCL